MSALAGLLANAKLLSYMRAFEPLSALVAVLAQVVKDALPFLTILLIVLLGFSSAMQSSGEYDSPTHSLYNTFLIALNSEVFIEDDGFHSVERKALQVFCLLFASVVMMNLLIAVISDSFERVQEKKHAQFLMGRAQLIRDNNAIFDFFGRVESRCRWLHVMQPVEGGGSDTQAGGATEWAGRVRALKKKMEALQLETRHELQGTRSEVEDARDELAETRAALDTLCAVQQNQAEEARHALEALHKAQQSETEHAKQRMDSILAAVQQQGAAAAGAE